MTTGNAQKLRLGPILVRYLHALRPYRGVEAMLLGLWGTGAVLTTFVAPQLAKRIVDAASAGGADAFSVMVNAVLLLAGTIVAYNVAYRIADYAMILVESKVLRDLHQSVHDHLHTLSYTFFANTFAGSLIAKTRRYVQAFETLHDVFFISLWIQGISLVVIVGVLFYESWVLGWLVLGWFALYIVVVRALIRFQLPLSLENAAADSRTTARYADIVSNILTVKMFGSAHREREAFAKTLDIQERIRRATWMRQGFWGNLVQGAFVGVFEVMLMGTVVYLWREGTVTVGTILLVQVYVFMIFDIVWQIGRTFIRAFTALSDANEMVEILDRQPDVRDPDVPEEVLCTSGAIAFSNVTHRYEGGGEPVFAGLTLDIPAGQKVAFVGRSGAGKTTIVKLLLRFLDVSEGEVRIDGQNITRVRQEDLRRHIAYVPQEPLLFHRTLRENIAYAKPDASEDEVVEAARRAHAHDFIAGLPKGYDTLVGERGVKLSGGERQRVAIARAMLMNAPIVVLDEATSSLDSVSERFIQEGFDALMEGRTTIVIAHRLSTIQHMDRIIVLGHGSILEDGNHETLIAQGGVYAELWNSQVGGFIGE